MRSALGISAGSDVVCSAVVTVSDTGEQSFDYRVVSADPAHSDLGDLVASSIELMTTGNGVSTAKPSAVAVAYRDKAQAEAIRAATTRRRGVRLVTEADASLAYLRDTGLLARYATIGLIDMGASGLTVTVADTATGEVLHSERATSLGGVVIDELLCQHLIDLHSDRTTRPSRATLTSRARAAKEHLSIAPAVSIDHGGTMPLSMTRGDFDEIIGGLLRNIARFITAAFTHSPTYPDAIVVIGGCANIPAVIDTVRFRRPIPVITVDDPEAVIAKGAALLALDLPSAPAPTPQDAPNGTLAKAMGVLAGVTVVLGLIIGYGVQTVHPDNHDVSPAGTSSTVRQGISPIPPPPTSVREAPTPTLTNAPPPPPSSPDSPSAPPSSASSASPSAPVSATAPTLRPDPNLPEIPYPSQSSFGQLDAGSGVR
ncbi:Hsp70 family protein [Nocardia camponoti]|uniref:Hsp70 family protein n=1 Tax=Nocardia camponoti TaxID=1616106 RepID=A0A917VAP7_9NOCA|nr:Hsp70 family protein [Nocardia camponoti]GGK56921.1 hypothetical protein GCM10011591_31320 [Nocardia camponoti]